jgi:hypothetical protein
MYLSKSDAIYAANVFTDFFSSMERIDDYMRQVKLERMANYPDSLPGMGPETDMFNDPNIHPNDMDISFHEVSATKLHMYLEITTSAAVESSIPGKSLCLLVKENNTNTILGMIRLGSPTINSKPRNEWLGRPLDSHNPKVMARFNASAIMGFAIVAVQPFGFNALGGKLLAAICCSHNVRRMLDEKYKTNYCMFETTSLYGSTKASSQYDGMKPFLRHNGLTVSNFAPLINDTKFRSLDAWFAERNGGEYLVDREATSRKLKTQTRMVSVIKHSLKEHDLNEYKKFCDMFKNALDLTEQKRSFISTYGYTAESVKNYMNLETDILVPAENFDRFEFENIVEWWRTKAARRYETLKSEGRLRTVQETWNTNPEDIDIIR